MRVLFDGTRKATKPRIALNLAEYRRICENKFAWMRFMYLLATKFERQTAEAAYSKKATFKAQRPIELHIEYHIAALREN